MNELYLYLIVVNGIAFALYGADKASAKQRTWRVPEKVLLGVAVIGGSVGSIVGMRVFRHKIRHRLFRYGLPAILFIQMCLAAYFALLH